MAPCRVVVAPGQGGAQHKILVILEIRKVVCWEMVPVVVASGGVGSTM